MGSEVTSRVDVVVVVAAAAWEARSHLLVNKHIGLGTFHVRVRNSFHVVVRAEKPPQRIKDNNVEVKDNNVEVKDNNVEVKDNKYISTTRIETKPIKRPQYM